MALIKELRFASRSLARTPGFTLLAVLTLGLGIGMSVAVWSIVDAVLIEPLPYPDADRLVEIRMNQPERGTAGYPMSALDYLEYAERNRSFEAMAATFRESLNLTGGRAPERVSGALVSAPFFTVMGVSPQVGRSFGVEEDEPGRDPVAVISHSLWQRSFGARPDVLGDVLVANGRPHTIVGVMPWGFSFPNDTELWLPIAIDPEAEDRGHGWVVPVGRMLPNVRLGDARSDLETIAGWMQQEYPDTNADRSVVLSSLKDTIVGGVRPSLVVLLTAVLCVLLIAAANVTILLSVRTSARQRELAVRHALGAGRGHLIRLVMTESVMLALGGCAVGLVIAHWGTRMMALRFTELIPRTDGLGFDAGILGVAVLVSGTVGLLSGIVPALRSREGRIMVQLREADRSVAGGSSSVGTAMVVAEIALSVVLLAGAVLLSRTFLNLLNVDPVFESDRVLTAEVSLTDERYAEEATLVEFIRRAVEEIDSIPEVEAAGTVYPLPLFGRRISTRSYVKGAPAPGPDAQRPLVELRFVSPGYLKAAGLHLVVGRFVDESDTSESPAVVVVNEAFVRQLVRHGSPVGRRTIGWDPAEPEADWETIVGGVRNTRHIDLADDAGPEMYVPVAQNGFEWATFVVRSRTTSAGPLANPIREAIQRLDPELPVFNVQTMTEVVNRSLARTTVVTELLALFAAAGLALAGVGVFSVVSYSVGRRVHEIAIRMAFGGTSHKVVGLVMKQGLVPTAAGLSLGVAVAQVLMRLLESRLYGVATHDPLTFSATAFLVFSIAALATWLPARRAARVDPMTVLRTE